MSELPWFRFYPDSWKADDALRMCSLAARGLWIELLCIMRNAEPAGHLLVKGRAPTLAQLARLCGCDEPCLTQGLTELETNGVFSRLSDDPAGVIYSRKMVRDAARSETAKANGIKGGNPRIKNPVKPQVNPPLKPAVMAVVIHKSIEDREQIESSLSSAGELLDHRRVIELAGDALASMATHPGVATIHPLSALLKGDPPCVPDDIYPAVVAAAAWWRRKGVHRMTNWDLAAKMAAENRDRRLAGAPPQQDLGNDGERTDDHQPRRTSDRTKSSSQTNLDALARAVNRRAAE